MINPLLPPPISEVSEPVAGLDLEQGVVAAPPLTLPPISTPLRVEKIAGADSDPSLGRTRQPIRPMTKTLLSVRQKTTRREAPGERERDLSDTVTVPISPPPLTHGQGGRLC